MKKILAIANCRVSSDEQLMNNSLNRQRAAVLAAADQLNASIPENGWWSGSVSSKKGNNLKRKDILEMLEYCKRNKDVKYLIIDEPDRFMRSVDEAIYYEVEFKKHGVKVWYASDNDLNSDDMSAKLMKFMKYFVAEGSNEERQRKSINGQAQALKEGRYPFAPKPGYVKGRSTGIQEIHPIRGPILRRLLIDIANYIITPSNALIELNKSEFVAGKAMYKMDKFRKIIEDPFYAGIVEINKQVRVRNENGLHEPLITKEQHISLLNIMSGKKKNQKGPRKNGNPEFPLSNLITCEKCKDERTGRFVGLNLNNGVNRQRVYKKYRCRFCKRYIDRSDLHGLIADTFEKYELDDELRKEFLKTLEVVWKREEESGRQELGLLRRRNDELQKKILQNVRAAADPSNAVMKNELMQLIEEDKTQLDIIKQSIEAFEAAKESNLQSFLEFALDFVDNLAKNFFELSQEQRQLCKQIIFPSGFILSKENIVYTPQISTIYRLAGKQKDALASSNSLMVRVKRL